MGQELLREKWDTEVPGGLAYQDEITEKNEK